MALLAYLLRSPLYDKKTKVREVLGFTHQENLHSYCPVGFDSVAAEELPGEDPPGGQAGRGSPALPAPLPAGLLLRLGIVTATVLDILLNCSCLQTSTLLVTFRDVLVPQHRLVPEGVAGVHQGRLHHSGQVIPGIS